MKSPLLPEFLEVLNNAILVVDAAPVECDGHTLMVSRALCEAGIQHERTLGRVSHKHDRFALFPHFWIEMDDYILDYRLRIWVKIISGECAASEAPHGFFIKDRSPSKYVYDNISLCPAPVISRNALNVMTDGYASQLIIPPATNLF